MSWRVHEGVRQIFRQAIPHRKENHIQNLNPAENFVKNCLVEQTMSLDIGLIVKHWHYIFFLQFKFLRNFKE